MKRGAIIFLLFFSGLFATASEEALGDGCEVTLPMRIPDGASQALHTYLDTIVAIQPEGYLLESYTIEPECLHLFGKMTEGKEKTIFLGAFVYGSFLISFPPFTVNVGRGPAAYSIAERETTENQALKDSAFLSFFQEGNAMLERQYLFQCLVWALFCLGATCILGRIAWKRRVVEEKPVPVEELLRTIKGKRDWTQLVAYLQKCSGTSLTSYELADFFLKRNCLPLSRAAILIEKYAYRPQPVPKGFDEAVACIEESIYGAR